MGASGSRTAKRLGELLVDRGLITRGQLERALALQRSRKTFLGQILIEEGWVGQEALRDALAEQFGMPVEPLDPGAVDWAVVEQFPTAALAAGRCFPIRATEETVTVALANPLDAEALSAVERRSGFREVRPVLVLERELEAVIQAWHQRSLRLVTDRLTGTPPEESGR